MWPDFFRSRFTLRESLVIIAMVGVVSGILLPFVTSPHHLPPTARAKRDLRHIEYAVLTYQSKYGKVPVSPEVLKSVGTNDFTYGTSCLKDEPFVGNKARGYQTNNAELMAVLFDMETYRNGKLTVNKGHSLNTQKIRLLSGKAVDGPRPGIDENGAYRDPWGHPYIITVDLNGDGFCDDPFDGRVEGKVFAWSLGKDGKADPNLKPDGGVNADNVTAKDNHQPAIRGQ